MLLKISLGFDVVKQIRNSPKELNFGFVSRQCFICPTPGLIQT
ncbi:hypothetical protein I600_1785 [Maribacter dokdonensis DSW-8]|nr:hypothetical protein I600_1785 [Maribacter dokdonensis DSW-8]